LNPTRGFSVLAINRLPRSRGWRWPGLARLALAAAGALTEVEGSPFGGAPKWGTAVMAPSGRRADARTRAALFDRERPRAALARDRPLGPLSLFGTHAGHPADGARHRPGHRGPVTGAGGDALHRQPPARVPPLAQPGPLRALSLRHRTGLADFTVAGGLGARIRVDETTGELKALPSVHLSGKPAGLAVVGPHAETSRASTAARPRSNGAIVCSLT